MSGLQTETNFKLVKHPASGKSLGKKEQDNLKKLFASLIRIAPPEDLGVNGRTDVQTYMKAFLAYLQKNPYLTSGEKFADGSRIFLTDKALLKEDWVWVESTIKSLIYEIRVKDQQFISTRLLNPASVGWIDWGTSECVFSAITLVMGLRFKYENPPGDQEAKEKELHIALAGELGISTGLVSDEVMSHLLQNRFKWRRLKKVTIHKHMGIPTYFDPGGIYVISCCENKRTDFWHTMLGVFTKQKTWKIVDRQFERRDSKERQFPLVTEPHNEVNLWRVELTSPLLKSIKQKLDIAKKKKDLADYLDDDWEV